MLSIPLTNGGAALIDACDAHMAPAMRWRKQWSYRDGERVKVASVVSGSHRKGTLVLLHRFLMNAPTGTVVDHIDGDPLNNTRANLRVCSPSENAKNRAMNYNSKLNRKGVYVVREPGKTTCFRSRIQVDGRRINLGRFDTAEEASVAYAEAASHYFGEFARAA